MIDQFHKIVYNILDEMMEGGNVERENNPYVKSGNTYRLNISNKNGENFLTYFFYEPGEDDDGNPSTPDNVAKYATVKFNVAIIFFIINI